MKNLFDNRLVSDFRTSKNNGKILMWAKRSKYKIIMPTEVNEKLAYITGVIVGDGNITITERGITKYPRMTLIIFNASKSYLEFLNKEFYGVFGIGGKIMKKLDKECYKLTITKKLIILYFLKIMGLTAGKKKVLKIPEAVKNKRLFKFFIAGLYDTDGYFSQTFGIMMSGSNYNFLKEITLLLERYYNISSRKLYFGNLITKTGLKTRAQTQIRARDVEKFIEIIPLKHSKY